MPSLHPTPITGATSARLVAQSSSPAISAAARFDHITAAMQSSEYMAAASFARRCGIDSLLRKNLEYVTPADVSEAAERVGLTPEQTITLKRALERVGLLV